MQLLIRELSDLELTKKTRFRTFIVKKVQKKLQIYFWTLMHATNRKFLKMIECI